jgi:hypothetical protein
LRKTYPLEVKREREAKRAEEERQTQRKRTYRLVMEALLKVFNAPMEWHEDERGNLIGRRNFDA